MTQGDYTFIFIFALAVGVLHLAYNFLFHTESKFWQTVDVIVILVSLFALTSRDEAQKIMKEQMNIIVKDRVKDK